MSTEYRQDYALRLVDISKTFERECVLDHVSFSVLRGEICCFMGENGAGKSTLMRIISGLEQPDSGQIQIGERTFKGLTVKDAQQYGIHIIMQHPELVPGLSIEDNVFLGRELCSRDGMFVNHTQQREQLQVILDKMDWQIDLSQLVELLSPMEQRLVDLAKALLWGYHIIIFDELSAFADAPQMAKIHSLVKRLSSYGISVIYISHCLEECFDLSNRLTILKGGRIAHDYRDLTHLSTREIIENLTDQAYTNRYPHTPSSCGFTMLRTENLCCTEHGIKDVNIQVCAGEIVGIVGLENCGSEILFRLLTGARTPSNGRIFVNGQAIRFSDAADAARHGIAAFSSEINDNLFQEMDSYFNVSIASLDRTSRTSFIMPWSVQASVQEYLTGIGFPENLLRRRTSSLSQGEKQKVALSKMMYSRRSIFIMNNPSVSLDMTSRVELYNALNWLAIHGHGILIFSSNSEEAAGMCDRVYIMRNSRIVNELRGSELNVTSLTLQVTGESR